MQTNGTSTIPAPESNKTGWPWTNVKSSYFSASAFWPKISIVTPSFNQGKYIEETILSVISQGYPNLEYIIIDGGSTDDTVAIIKKYEEWISYWVSESDSGQSHAINKGLERCTGEIFNWINSDDWYMPYTFSEVATTFMKDPELLVVAGFENHRTQDGGTLLHKGTFLKATLEQTIELCEVAQPSTFFKLTAIRQIGGVSEDLHYIMDGEMWVRLLLRYGQEHFINIEKVLVNFRLHRQSKTVSNAVVDNFLYERCSIITDLQKFVGVNADIIRYYISEIYKSPKVYQLNRLWQINDKVITKRHLRIYFIQKYVTNQFRSKNRQRAYWGLKQLIKNRAFDFYLLKNIIKLAIKT